MKKSFLLIYLFLAVGFAFAQKSSVKAVKDALSESNLNYEDARARIKEALNDPEAISDPETWYVAGQLEDKIFSKESNKIILKQEPDYPVMYGALENSYGYFLKAIELEKIPDEKGKVKNKVTKQIKSILKINQVAYSESGAYYYNNAEYAKAYDAFGIFLAIPKLEMFQKEKLMPDSVYSQIKLYTAYAATYDDEPKIPEAIAILEELKGKNYELTSVYQTLAQNYRQAKDTVKYVATLKEGFNKFPNGRYFISSMIDFFIDSENIDEALIYLDKAIELDPENPAYWSAKGDLYAAKDDPNQALTFFEEALKIDSNFPRAIAGIGRTYYHQGLLLQRESNDQNSLKNPQQVQKEINELYRKALPYLEKAHQAEPDNRQYIMALYGVYYALEMPEVEKMEKLLGIE